MKLPIEIVNLIKSVDGIYIKLVVDEEYYRIIFYDENSPADCEYIRINKNEIF